MRKAWAIGSVALLGVGLSALVMAQATRSLVINGRVATTDVRTINGRAYAPVADIAKALGMTVVSRPNGTLELTKAGGSGPMQGDLNGKVGDWLFDGGWRFRVDSIDLVDRYNCENDYYGTTEYTAEEGKQLAVVRYAIRNGNKELGGFGFDKTAIAGANGDSEPVFANDFRFDGSLYFSKPILPGAEMRGALLFQVPSGFRAKDLVVTIGDLSHYDEAVRPKSPSVLRISLQ